MTDELPNVLTAEVKTTEGHEYEVRCLMVSAARQCLSIELTNENMELLQADPRPDTDSDNGAPPFQPTITHANVKWNAKQSSVYCTYFDAAKGKRTRKSFRVVRGPSGCPVEFQKEVDSMAKVAADFHALHHAFHGSKDISSEIIGHLEPV